MDSLDSIRVKLEAGFDEPGLVLKFDPSCGHSMPYILEDDRFLEEARKTARSDPATPHIEVARRRAAWLRYDLFLWNCSVHGVTAFRTQTCRCVECSQPGRKARNAARHESRKLGLPAYIDNCTVHGECTFSTARGLCLSCYNTLGQPRPLSTNPLGFYVGQDGNIKEVR